MDRLDHRRGFVDRLEDRIADRTVEVRAEAADLERVRHAARDRQRESVTLCNTICISVSVKTEHFDRAMGWDRRRNPVRNTHQPRGLTDLGAETAGQGGGRGHAERGIQKFASIELERGGRRRRFFFLIGHESVSLATDVPTSTRPANEISTGDTVLQRAQSRRMCWRSWREIDNSFAAPRTLPFVL